MVFVRAGGQVLGMAVPHFPCFTMQNFMIQSSLRLRSVANDPEELFFQSAVVLIQRSANRSSVEIAELDTVPAIHAVDDVEETEPALLDEFARIAVRPSDIVPDDAVTVTEAPFSAEPDPDAPVCLH